MSRLPMSVTAHSGMLSQNPQALMVSTSSCGSVAVPMPLAPAVADDLRDHALHDVKHRQHQVHSEIHGGFRQHKADKQFEGVFRFFDLHKAAAGLDHTGGEEQHQQPVPNGLQRAVDAGHDAPHRAAVVADRAGGQQLPDLGQLVVPGVEGVGQVIHDPVIVRIASPPSW